MVTNVDEMRTILSAGCAASSYLSFSIELRKDGAPKDSADEVHLMSMLDSLYPQCRWHSGDVPSEWEGRAPCIQLVFGEEDKLGKSVVRIGNDGRSSHAIGARKFLYLMGWSYNSN